MNEHSVLAHWLAFARPFLSCFCVCFWLCLMTGETWLLGITSLNTRGTRAQGRHDVTTPTTPTTTQRMIGAMPQSHFGLCGTPVGPARTPMVHRCPRGKAVGGPQQALQRRPPTNDNNTQTSLETNVLSATGVMINLESFMFGSGHVGSRQYGQVLCSSNPCCVHMTTCVRWQMVHGILRFLVSARSWMLGTA